jgi:hypothetical protein
MPAKLNMTLDNPRMTAMKNNLALLNSIKNEKQSNNIFPGKQMDLGKPMLDRVIKVRSGCGGCGGAR